MARDGRTGGAGRPGARPADRDGPPRAAWKRLVWFVALWAGGVLAVAAVGYAIRLAIMP